MAIGEASVSEGKVRVFIRRRFELLDSFVESFSGAFVPIVTPFQIMLIRFIVVGVFLRQLLLAFA